MKAAACNCRASIIIWVGIVFVVHGVYGFGFGFEEGGLDELDETLFNNLTQLGLGVNGYGDSKAGSGSPVMVGLTLIHAAAAKQAVCLDGSLPGYHYSPGSGSGSRSWLIQLEGGGWCNAIRSCVYQRKLGLDHQRTWKGPLLLLGY